MKKVVMMAVVLSLIVFAAGCTPKNSDVGIKDKQINTSQLVTKAFTIIGAT